jgi:hypothetical protein
MKMNMDTEMGTENDTVMDKVTEKDTGKVTGSRNFGEISPYCAASFLRNISFRGESEDPPVEDYCGRDLATLPTVTLVHSRASFSEGLDSNESLLSRKWVSNYQFENTVGMQEKYAPKLF